MAAVAVAVGAALAVAVGAAVAVAAAVGSGVGDEAAVGLAGICVGYGDDAVATVGLSEGLAGNSLGTRVFTSNSE